MRWRKNTRARRRQFRRRLARSAARSIALSTRGWRKRAWSPPAVISDAAFLRRVTLDTIGLLPTSEEVDRFLADPAPDKRARAIDRLLADPRWADHWMPYWQDVLAENPAILKATLNNTGPFRWFLHDALLDNKPMDRFVTELVAHGRQRAATAAAPASASPRKTICPWRPRRRSSAPPSSAMEMKCARCHDAPNHPFNQEDLFARRHAPARAGESARHRASPQGSSANSHVVVSLKAGAEDRPALPFRDLPVRAAARRAAQRRDTREQLAAILTDPRNDALRAGHRQPPLEAAPRLRHRRAGR